MHKAIVVWGSVLLLLLAGCDPARVYEQNIDLPEAGWAIDNEPIFEFEIQDTTQVYDLYLNVRYSLQYDYYNLYVRHTLTGPDDARLSSALHELLLLDAKTGKPLGNGSTDTYDLQSLILDNVTFGKVGTYRLRLTQYMRRDPLPHVLAVGVRVADSAVQ